MALVRKPASQVAISDDFLGALEKLPGQVRPRVRQIIRLFYQNPAHPSLNYEGIREAREPRLRSIRVTDDYRAIVAHPQGDGTYVLLWVDKHEAAYRWARTHYLSPDDARGLVVVPTSERDAQSPASSLGTALAPEAGLLAHCTDEQLLQAGVPAILMPTLRACATHETLMQVLGVLQANVAEAVRHLALDDNPGERPLALREPELTPAATPEPDPIEVALSRPESRRRFVMVTSQHELEQALNYPLERWRLFLHPSQQSIVQRRFDGPALVSGGSGTGKTVIGLHRALSGC
ncbi:MAG TPA: hypothetical protein VKT82_16485 [Ktedonobacterales bacterium]|nr:hypothetical protein [Ktedonobacterales bacterium]